jgi:hypothetical protein
VATDAKPAAPEARAGTLGAALAHVGLSCRIDPQGTAAFLHPADELTIVRLGDQAMRRDVLALGRAHGFTHVAVVVGDG